MPRYDAVAARIPGVAALADAFARLGRMRYKRVPVGLLALLPVAILIDTIDAIDELLGGPIGMVVSFILQSAFLLGLTGRASYAFGLAGLDLIPIVDVLPWATITLVREIIRAWAAPVPAPEPPPRGPIIDV